MAKGAGFTGLSILHRLNNLHGFNILEDMVFDAMHNIALNVASQHLHCYVEKDMVPKRTVELRLNSVPWTVITAVAGAVLTAALLAIFVF